MAFLELVFLVAVAHSLTVPVSCGDSDYQQASDGSNVTAAIEACIATRWCVWQGEAGVGSNCIPDSCLEWYADDDAGAQTACGLKGPSCTLYYITDTVNCSDPLNGAPKSRTDLFCRTGSATITKKPVDACFHQDLKARSQATPGTACGNTAGLVCAWDGDNHKYCYDTGAPQPIASYGVDDAAYCQSLGTAYCNLYPLCTLNSAGDKCVIDPCSALDPQAVLGSDCLGPGGTHCVTATAQSVSGTGTISLISSGYQCVSKESWGGVKKNEYNSCFFAYTGAKVANASAFDHPSCYSVSERDKCGGASGDAVVYNNQGTTPTTDTYCQLVDIAEGWLPTEKLCWDGIVSYPKPDAGFAVHVPSLVLLVVALIAALL